MGRYKVVYFLPQILIGWLGVHVGQAIPAEAVEQAAALQLLHDDGDELRVAGRQRGRVGSAGPRARGRAARAPSTARSAASPARPYQKALKM